MNGSLAQLLHDPLTLQQESLCSFLVHFLHFVTFGPNSYSPVLASPFRKSFLRWPKSKKCYRYLALNIWPSQWYSLVVRLLFCCTSEIVGEGEEFHCEGEGFDSTAKETHCEGEEFYVKYISLSIWATVPFDHFHSEVTDMSPSLTAIHRLWQTHEFSPRPPFSEAGSDVLNQVTASLKFVQFTRINLFIVWSSSKLMANMSR